MNPRTRVLKSMNHEQPDRVPLFYRDVPEVEAKLLKELELRNRDELLDYLEIDFRWVEPVYKGSEPKADTQTKKNIWGVEYHYKPFDENAGYWEVVENPLKNCHDLTCLADYNWPGLDWFDFSVLNDAACEYPDYMIMTAPGCASPGPLLILQELIGEERAWTEFLINPDFYFEIMKRIMGFIEPFVENMLAACGGKIDFARIGDDFGSQRGLLMSVDQWNKSLRPYYERLAQVIHKHDTFYYHHSCGAIRDIIPEMIDIGVDVIDPLQVTADNMEPAGLKRDFGHKIVFSGGVDEQQLLSKGTTQDVELAMCELLNIMAAKGGFFIGPTHNFQYDIPVENILTMYRMAKDWSLAIN